MKHMKKLIAAFLALAMAFSPCAATVQAAPKVPKSLTVYLWAQGSSMTQSNIPIRGLSKSQKVTNLRSSDQKVIENNGIMVDGDNIWFKVRKTGKATISFKIGSKTYQTKITSKKHVNPVKSLSITGVKNKGKTNLASLSNKSNQAELKTSKPKAAPTFKVSAKKGWKVSEVSYMAAGDVGPAQKEYKKPVANTTLKLKKKTSYVSVTFVNTKNKGDIGVVYFINN